NGNDECTEKGVVSQFEMPVPLRSLRDTLWTATSTRKNEVIEKIPFSGESPPYHQLPWRYSPSAERNERKQPTSPLRETRRRIEVHKALPCATAIALAHAVGN